MINKEILKDVLLLLGTIGGLGVIGWIGYSVDWTQGLQGAATQFWCGVSCE